MPDLDIIDRNVLRGWRRPVRVLLGEGSPEEVAYEAKIAIARSLRETGGLPGLDDLVAILRQRMAGELDPHSAHVRITAYENRFGHERHAKIAAAAARRLLVKLNQGQVLGESLPLAVAHAFIRELLEHNVFGRVGPNLGRHFRGWEEAHRRAQECRSAFAPDLERLAQQLVANPGAADLRAPPAPRGFRRSTADQLHQPIM